MSHDRPIRNTANASTVAAAILATAVVPGWARAAGTTVFTDESDASRIETRARTAATGARQWQ
jgi:hypothetical protein